MTTDRKTPLTDAQMAAYVASSGPGRESTCPYCGGADLSYDRVEMVEASCFQPVECETCHRFWSDRYEFAGIEEDERLEYDPPGEA